MSFLRAAVIFGGLAFAFQYEGSGEPFVWAIAVTLAIAVALPPTLKRSDFAPHWVRIWPTGALLRETGIATEESLKRLEEVGKERGGYGWEPDENGQGEHSFLRNGIRFTVLKPDDFDQGGLVYWNRSKVFSTSAEQTFLLEELARPHPSLPGKTMAPCLSLEPVRDGLSLRLATVKEIADANDVEDPYPGREIALIPWAEFRGYGSEKMKKLREAQLAKHGWKRDTDDEDHRLGGPSELHHKFFSVEWDYI